LGEQLTDALGAPREADMLSRWMVYYIGEQIAASKTIAEEKRPEVEKRVFETILALWAHRNHLPNGFRPFRGFEPILRALERLDPDSPRPAFFQLQGEHEKVGCDAQREKIESWLNFAYSTDSTARILIDIGLTLAARQAETKATGIVLESAPKSTLPDDVTAIRKLLKRGKSLTKEEAAVARVEQLKDHVERLAWFRRVSKKMEKHLAEQLKQARRELHI
jgi:hypothetical protein